MRGLESRDIVLIGAVACIAAIGYSRSKEISRDARKSPPPKAIYAASSMAKTPSLGLFTTSFETTKTASPIAYSHVTGTTVTPGGTGCVNTPSGSGGFTFTSV